MAARSEHGAYIRGLAPTLIVAKGPVDAGACRDALVNNANHLLDECTEARGAITLAAGDYYTITDATAADTFGVPFGLYPIEMPLQVRSDGRSVLVVPHLRALVSASTLTIRVFLSLSSTTRSGGVDVPAVGDSCSEVTTTSTSAVDLTPDPIFLPASAYEAGRALRPDRSLPGRRIPSLNGNGDLASVTMLTAYLHVRWKVPALSTPQLFGLSWREYIDG